MISCNIFAEDRDGEVEDLSKQEAKKWEHYIVLGGVRKK